MVKLKGERPVPKKQVHLSTSAELARMFPDLCEDEAVKTLIKAYKKQGKDDSIVGKRIKSVSKVGAVTIGKEANVKEPGLVIHLDHAEMIFATLQYVDSKPTAVLALRRLTGEYEVIG